MIPIRDTLLGRRTPVVAWTLIGLNILIYFWDRNWSLFGQSIVFADMAMRPIEVVRALTGQGDFGEFGKVFTSLFLHANLAHLLGNLLFLFIFGDNVEQALGSWRFMLYYIFWGLLAAAAHIFIYPNSTVPTLGASGAIGGVLGTYFLLFPSNKVTVIIPPLFFLPFTVQAWLPLGMWFLFQIFIEQSGVANWAHVGGFLAGMVTVLIMGGRVAVLRKERWKEPHERTYDAEAA